MRKNIKTVVKNIKAYMKLRNMNAKELCEKIGITRSTFYAWMNGTNEMGLNKLLAVSEALNVDIEYFFYRDDEISYETKTEDYNNVTFKLVPKKQKPPVFKWKMN